MGVSMMVLFPLTFLSNVFVDPSTMPGWLQAFVKVNPITHLVTAIRAAMAGNVGPDEHAVAAAVERRLRGGLRHADHAPLQPPLTLPRPDRRAPPRLWWRPSAVWVGRDGQTTAGTSARVMPRRRAASWLGGAPNWRRYSRLNCDGLS